MSEFNSCAGLVDEIAMNNAHVKYYDTLTDRRDPLQIMLDMQAGLQKELAQKFDHVADITELETCGEMHDWLKWCDDSIDDERRELYTALGGMSNGKEASAVWKKWKARHMEARNTKFTELTPADQLEAKFELIDQLHFVLCQFLVMGMSADEIFKLYYLKNAENFARQERGY